MLPSDTQKELKQDMSRDLNEKSKEEPQSNEITQEANPHSLSQLKIYWDNNVINCSYALSQLGKGFNS